MLEHVTIVGSGSWATALVKIFSESHVDVSWLVRSEDQAVHIRSYGRNPRYLTYAELDTAFIHPTVTAQTALQDSELVIFAIPSAYLQNAVSAIDTGLLSEKQLAVSIKGFIPDTGDIPSTYLFKYYNATQPLIVIGGPCHAEEIAMKRNTYVTVAGENSEWVQTVCKKLDIHYICTVASSDPIGIEYCAILKNIIGIATGIASGLNYGENFQAVLTSNAMGEVRKFLNVVDPKERELFDSVYFGDILVTAYSDYSRNRTLGKLIGRGLQVNRALQTMDMVAEGYYASRELMPLLKRLKLSFPVINSVYRILHQHANPFHEFKLIEKHLR